jgi:hypothetical protein
MYLKRHLPDTSRGVQAVPGVSKRHLIPVDVPEAPVSKHDGWAVSKRVQDGHGCVQAVPGVSKQYLECPSSTWSVQAVPGVSKQYLECPRGTKLWYNHHLRGSVCKCKSSLVTAGLRSPSKRQSLTAGVIRLHAKPSSS